MLKLKNDQKLYILKSGGKWFTCISNNDGLISYSDNLYIVDSQQGTTINIKSFQAAYDEIKNFDLVKEVEQLMSVEDYSALVDKVMYLQNILFFGFLCLFDFCVWCAACAGRTVFILVGARKSNPNLPHAPKHQKL